MNFRPKLLVFEGPDDVGKTTVAQATKEALSLRGVLSVAYHFPGSTTGEIKDLIYGIHEARATLCSPSALQALHVSAHIDIVERQLRPAWETHNVVILDRFYWSTLAYGRAAGVDPKLLDLLVAAEKVAWKEIVPNGVILLKRQIPKTPEADRLWREYRALAEPQSEHHVVWLSNDGPLEDTVAAVLENLSQW